MTISVQHPTAGKKALTLRGIRLNGVDHSIISGRITHPTLGDKQFWDGSSPAVPIVTASPPFVSGGITKSGPVTTAGCVASASGGSAPYSYSWALVSDDGLGGTWSVNAPSSPTTSFTASHVGFGVTSDATFRCAVTDARGATATVDVAAEAISWGA